MRDVVMMCVSVVHTVGTRVTGVCRVARHPTAQAAGVANATIGVVSRLGLPACTTQRTGAGPLRTQHRNTLTETIYDISHR